MDFNYKEIEQSIGALKSFQQCKWVLELPSVQNEDLIDIIAKKRNIDTTKTHDDILNEALEKAEIYLPNIDKAFHFLEQHDIFAIVGDYDADGIISTAQLVMLADIIGKKAIPFLPNRFIDGYGLSTNIVENIIERGVKLVITVDNGTTAYDQIKMLHNAGVTTIVIDHHVLQDAINIDAFINPFLMQEKNDYRELAASGLVLMFIYYVLKKYNKLEHFNRFLGIATIGTICDMVPLNKINRAIVKCGIDALNKNTPPWMNDIIKNKEIHEKGVGYIIGPILNVSGRFGVAHLSLQLITSIGDEYQTILKDLRVKIFQRRLIECAVRYDICGDKNGEQQKKELSTKWSDKLPLVVDCGDIVLCAHKFWHEGVLGIVAGNMKDLYHKTVIILTQHNDTYKGSIRSIKGLHVGNLINELKQAKIAIQGGGHEMAGGLTVKDLYKLYVFCTNYKAPIMEKELIIEGICSLSVVRDHFVKKLKQLGPFGIKNNEVLFLFPNCKIVKIYQNPVKNCIIFFFSHPNLTLSVYTYVQNKSMEAFIMANRNCIFFIVGAVVQYNTQYPAQLNIYDIKVQQ